MAEQTKIEWCDSSWSPWFGCTKVSLGCNNCYAAVLNKRFAKGENWGPGAPRREYREAHWKKPLTWNVKADREGRRLRVFPSVCDPFDNEVPDEWRARFFSLIAKTPYIDWLLLTKRIGNAREMLRLCWLDSTPFNIWLGVTVVNQEEADRDIPKLLATPARVRFISYEPALGPIEIGPYLSPHFRAEDGSNPENHKLDLVIAGGESGPQARPAQPEWFRSLRDQCAVAGVAFFMKQMGGVRDKRGALDDLPEDLRVREMPHMADFIVEARP